MYKRRENQVKTVFFGDVNWSDYPFYVCRYKCTYHYLILALYYLSRVFQVHWMFVIDITAESIVFIDRKIEKLI